MSIQTLDYVDKVINDIVEFVLKNTHYLVSNEELERVIRLHILYGTCCILHDKEKVIGVVRWNVEGNKAKILDLIIDKDYRNKGIMAQMLKKGLSLFPNLKELGWERAMKRNDRGMRYYSVKKLLQEV